MIGVVDLIWCAKHTRIKGLLPFVRICTIANSNKHKSAPSIPTYTFLSRGKFNDKN